MVGYGGKDLSLLSWYRMFLQVIWLLEICMDNAMSIQITSWQGVWSTVGELTWSMVHPPLESEWHQWQQALTRTLQLDWWQNYLNHCLGFPRNSHTGGFMKLQVNDCGIAHMDNQWVRYSVIPRRSHMLSFHGMSLPSHQHPEPKHLQRAMMLIQGNIITLMGHGPILPPNSEHSTGLTALRQLPFAMMRHLKTQVIGKLGLLHQDRKWKRICH